MPTSPALLALADALVSDLNTASGLGSFETTFTAARVYLPQKDIKDIGTVAVEVAAVKELQTIQTRNASEVDYQINVGIRQKVSSTAAATLDPLVYLVQQIADYFKGRTITGRTEGWIKSEVPQAYEPNILDTQKTFQAVVQLTFRGRRTH